MSWRDNLQMPVPGYRDRMVHISHSDREGLKMAADVIKTMIKRGERAGDTLLTSFDWDNYRYGSTMDCLEAVLEKFGNNYRNPLREDLAIWNVINGQGQPPSYPWHEGQQSWVPQATAELASLAAKWFKGRECFSIGAPKPTPEMRIAPKI